MADMPGAFICDAVRTPFGRFVGALACVRADGLAARSGEADFLLAGGVESMTRALERV